MSNPEPVAQADPVGSELRMPLPASTRLLACLPDLVLGLMFAYTAIWLIGLWWPEHWTAKLFPQRTGVDDRVLWTIVAFEVAWMWPQMILVDLASRVLKRPSLGKAVLAFIVLAGLMGAFNLDWLRSLTFATVIPYTLFFLTIWLRASMLWTLPGKPKIDRERARAISGGRFCIALTVLAVAAVIALGLPMLERTTGTAWGNLSLDGTGLNPLPHAVAALYFLIASVDQWRVGGAAFARQPRPLLWWDRTVVCPQDRSV